MMTWIPWKLNEPLKFGIFCTNFFRQVKMTASMFPTSVRALASFRCRALYVMELSKLKDCGDDILLAAKIKILAPQKLAKDCLSDVGFPPCLTKHKGMLVRFKRTLDRPLLLDSDSPEKASKVAR
jgi:hypothetical protein